MAVGKIVIIASVDIYHQRGPLEVFCAAIISGRVWAFWKVRINANKNSFHANTTEIKKVATIPGLDKGKIILIKICTLLAPSTRVYKFSS